MKATGYIVLLPSGAAINAKANAAGFAIKRAPNPTDPVRDFAVVTATDGSGSIAR